MNIELIEETIGRPLTASERSTFEWLSGWERSTCENVMGIIMEAWRRGFELGRSKR
ncbi:hypothetical protein ABEV74_11075 [Paenibacillus cisolokensis]|uniref:hypothetical protein n=1 Tax=Paenibacillus cisolokensis TaxID=1658519 RepID=UPI003D2BEEB7